MSSNERKNFNRSMPRARLSNRSGAAAEIRSGGEARPPFSGPSVPPEALAEHISVHTSFRDAEVGYQKKKKKTSELRSRGAHENQNTGSRGLVREMMPILHSLTGMDAELAEKKKTIL